MTTTTAEPVLAAQQPYDGAPTWTPSRLPLPHLTKALRELRASRGDVDTYWDYHDGDHDQIWLNDSLRKAFGGRGMSDMQDNYCGLAVWAPLSRLAVTGWQSRKLAEAKTPEAKTRVAKAAASWEDNGLDLEQDDVTRHVLVAGSSFIQVWPRLDPNGEQATGDDGEPLWDVVHKDARNVYVEPGAKPRSRRWACLVWREEDRWRATLYYSDLDGLPAEVVRLHTPPVANLSRDFPQQAGRFVLDADDPGGPMPEAFGGRCPIVPFKLDTRGRSYLRDVVPIQDKINKLAANKMVAAEFLAFPQRYVLTDQNIPDGVLRYSPAKVLQLDPGGGVNKDTGEAAAPTSVGEFSTADLEIYDKAQQHEVDKLFTIKLLPRHLQVSVSAGASGESIKADEGPFTSFCKSVAKTLGASWTDVQQLMGYDVKPVWADPEVANAIAEADELERLVRAGVPLLQALRRVGWTDDEITEVEGALEALRITRERADQAATLAQQQARPAADLGNTDAGMSLDGRVKMANELVRTGWEPVSVANALDLPPELVHTGHMPTSVQADAPPDPTTDQPPSEVPPALADQPPPVPPGQAQTQQETP